MSIVSGLGTGALFFFLSKENFIKFNINKQNQTSSTHSYMAYLANPQYKSALSTSQVRPTKVYPCPQIVPPFITAPLLFRPIICTSIINQQSNLVIYPSPDTPEQVQVHPATGSKVSQTFGCTPCCVDTLFSPS